MTPPQFLFVELYQGCNLRCEHCSYWQREDKRKVKGALRDQIMEEYATLAPGAAVVTCGGEATIQLEDYFQFMATARRLGLRSLSVTNGTTITRDNAARFIEEGPDEISISLDSAIPEKHDEFRGKAGSWQRVTNGIRLLVQARKTSIRKPKINVMTIVGERSYRDLASLYDLVLNDIGADKMKLNMIQPSFGGSVSRTDTDAWFAANVIQDVDALMNIIAQAKLAHQLNLNPAWLDNVRMYFESLLEDRQSAKGWSSGGTTRTHICNTEERNIMLDGNGRMSLCFSNAFMGSMYNQPGDLVSFWNNANWRPKMAKCNRYCGISHSVRREPATTR